MFQSEVQQSTYIGIQEQEEVTQPARNALPCPTLITNYCCALQRRFKPSSQLNLNETEGYCYASDVSFLNTRADQPHSPCFVPSWQYQAATGWDAAEKGNKGRIIKEQWEKVEWRQKEKDAITSVTCLHLCPALPPQNQRFLLIYN